MTLARIRLKLYRSPKAAVGLAILAGILAQLAAPAASQAYSPKLLRYPYLTDVVGTSATVNWATDRSATKGVLRWGTVEGGSCTANSKGATRTSITVKTLGRYQWKAKLTLSPDTEYCYRVYLGDAPEEDLLDDDPSPRFRSQLPAGSNEPFTFAVFGNWAQVDSTGANPDQANLMQQIAAAGARFAVTTGDNAYNSGTQTNYGDLVQTGAGTSAVFGPAFWKVPGASLPLFPALGNHGISTANTHFLNWPQAEAVASSGGRYVNDTYCCLNGTDSRKYGSAWYAFDAGNARFYVLQASWADTNVGTATDYQNDYDYHWAPGTPQREWLELDLAAHPSQLKFAFFHYPIHADNRHKSSDPFLQGPGNLEGLLSRHGVNIAFSGHAHVYQRNLKAHPDGLVTYVTGGGGAKLAPIGIDGCSAVNAYGIGWGNTNGTGYACGGAPRPTAKDQVFHYLRVSVDGTRVTVTPIDSLGRSFDQATYDFGQTADISVTSDAAPDPVPAWQRLTYTATVANAGSSTATGVTLAEELPVTASFEAATPSQGSCSHSSGTVRCDLGELEAGASATVEIEVLPQEEGTITSTVSAHADQVDPATADNYSSSEVVVEPSQADLQTFTPTDDTYVRADQPGAAFGGDDAMVVDADPEKSMLLKFQVSGIGGGEVVSATLRLYCVGDAVRSGGEFHATANGWTEATVTWDDAPAAEPLVLGSLGRVSAGSWYEVDVTPLVTGDGPHSLRVTSPSADGADYATKEGTFGFAPQLVVRSG